MWFFFFFFIRLSFRSGSHILECNASRFSWRYTRAAAYCDIRLLHVGFYSLNYAGVVRWVTLLGNTFLCVRGHKNHGKNGPWYPHLRSKPSFKRGILRPGSILFLSGRCLTFLEPAFGGRWQKMLFKELNMFECPLLLFIRFPKFTLSKICPIAFLERPVIA